MAEEYGGARAKTTKPNSPEKKENTPGSSKPKKRSRKHEDEYDIHILDTVKFFTENPEPSPGVFQFGPDTVPDFIIRTDNTAHSPRNIQHLVNGHSSASTGLLPAANGHSPAANGHSPAANGHSPAANSHSPAANGHSPAANGHSPAANGHSPAANGHSPATNGHSPAANGIGSLVTNGENGLPFASGENGLPVASKRHKASHEFDEAEASRGRERAGPNDLLQAAVGNTRSELAMDDSDRSGMAVAHSDRSEMAATDIDRSEMAVVDSDRSEMAATDSDTSGMAAAGSDRSEMAAAGSDRSEMAAAGSDRSEMAAAGSDSGAASNDDQSWTSWSPRSAYLEQLMGDAVRYAKSKMERVGRKSYADAVKYGIEEPFPNLRNPFEDCAKDDSMSNSFYSTSSSDSMNDSSTDDANDSSSDDLDSVSRPQSNDVAALDSSCTENNDNSKQCSSNHNISGMNNNMTDCDNVSNISNTNVNNSNACDNNKTCDKTKAATSEEEHCKWPQNCDSCPRRAKQSETNQRVPPGHKYCVECEHLREERRRQENHGMPCDGGSACSLTDEGAGNSNRFRARGKPVSEADRAERRPDRGLTATPAELPSHRFIPNPSDTSIPSDRQDGVNSSASAGAHTNEDMDRRNPAIVNGSQSSADNVPCQCGCDLTESADGLGRINISRDSGAPPVESRVNGTSPLVARNESSARIVNPCTAQNGLGVYPLAMQNYLSANPPTVQNGFGIHGINPLTARIESSVRMVNPQTVQNYLGVNTRIVRNGSCVYPPTVQHGFSSHGISSLATTNESNARMVYSRTVQNGIGVYPQSVQNGFSVHGTSPLVARNESSARMVNPPTAQNGFGVNTQRDQNGFGVNTQTTQNGFGVNSFNPHRDMNGGGLLMISRQTGVHTFTRDTDPRTVTNAYNLNTSTTTSRVNMVGPHANTNNAQSDMNTSGVSADDSPRRDSMLLPHMRPLTIWPVDVDGNMHDPQTGRIGIPQNRPHRSIFGPNSRTASSQSQHDPSVHWLNARLREISLPQCTPPQSVYSAAFGARRCNRGSSNADGSRVVGGPQVLPVGNLDEHVSPENPHFTVALIDRMVDVNPSNLPSVSASGADRVDLDRVNGGEINGSDRWGRFHFTEDDTSGTMDDASTTSDVTVTTSDVTVTTSDNTVTTSDNTSTTADNTSTTADNASNCSACLQLNSHPRSDSTTSAGADDSVFENTSDDNSLDRNNDDNDELMMGPRRTRRILEQAARYSHENALRLIAQGNGIRRARGLPPRSFLILGMAEISESDSDETTQGAGYQGLASGRETTQGAGYQGLASGRETTQRAGYQGLASGRETTQGAGYQGLASGRETTQGAGYQGLASGRETTQRAGYQGLASGRETTQGAGYQGLASGRETTQGAGYQGLASGRDSDVNWFRRSAAADSTPERTSGHFVWSEEDNEIVWRSVSDDSQDENRRDNERNSSENAYHSRTNRDSASENAHHSRTDRDSASENAYHSRTDRDSASENAYHSRTDRDSTSENAYHSRTNHDSASENAYHSRTDRDSASRSARSLSRWPSNNDWNSIENMDRSNNSRDSTRNALTRSRVSIEYDIDARLQMALNGVPNGATGCTRRTEGLVPGSVGRRCHTHVNASSSTAHDPAGDHGTRSRLRTLGVDADEDDIECDCRHCELVRELREADDREFGEEDSMEPEWAADAGGLQGFMPPDHFFRMPARAEAQFRMAHFEDFPDLIPALSNSDRMDLMLRTVMERIYTTHPGTEPELQPTPATQASIDSIESIQLSPEHIEQTPICAICLCNSIQGETMSRLRCGHIFHQHCVNVWLNKSNSCPVCRQPI